MLAPLRHSPASWGTPSPRRRPPRAWTPIAARPEHAAFVACLDAGVVGWAHIHASCDFERGPHAVIEGLVVDAAARRGGVATALLEAVERWAAEAGLPFVRLYSHVTRAEAHAFYARRGFEQVATSHQYRKVCSPRPGTA